MQTKNWIVIGAGLMGREACNYALDCGYRVKGFLDSRTTILQGFAGYPPVLGAPESYAIQPGDCFICAIGEPAVRRRYVELMSSRGAVFARLIHPKAYVGRNVEVGEGSIVAPHATLTCDVVVGRHVIVNVNASISHDCQIGDFVSLSPTSCLAGLCSLEDEVFVGVGATLIPHVNLGKGVYVAAGAVVVSSCNAGRLMGVPAKVR